MDIDPRPNRFETARTKPQIIADLEALATEPGFIYSLLCLYVSELLPACLTFNRTDRLSDQERLLLAGLMVKHPIRVVTPEEQRSDQPQDRANELLREPQHALNSPSEEVFAEQTQPRRFPVFSAQDMQEVMFYSIGPAFASQFLDFAALRYERDSEWLKKHKGVDVQDMVLLYRELRLLLERKIQPPHVAGGESGSRSFLLSSQRGQPI